jgi:hypothetical protein
MSRWIYTINTRTGPGDVATNGSVGIGIDLITPTAKLEIKGTTSDSSSSCLKITDSSSRNNLYIRNDGRMDVGTGIVMVPAPTNVASIDRKNIQDAIDQVASNGGGKVLFQKGVYSLEPTVINAVKCCIYLYAGVHLIGVGMFATILNARDSDCDVIVTDPAIFNGSYYEVRYGIAIKNLQVIAGPNSRDYSGISLNGVGECFLEMVYVNGNYDNTGYCFNRGMYIKGWVGTFINCLVTHAYLGYDLSWQDVTPVENTNAMNMIGCHYEGGNLPPPSFGSLLGCCINGFANCFTNCVIERRLVEAVPLETIAVYIAEDGGNTFIGCYFEGWKTTYFLDGCTGTNIVGGFMSACYLINPIQYLNGAENTQKMNHINNVDCYVLNYDGASWVLAYREEHSEIDRISIAPHGTSSDNGYNGNLIITKPEQSGQYINLVRSHSYPWSIGTVYNTNNFAIGTGQGTDSSFVNPFFMIQTDGNVGMGTNVATAKLDLNPGVVSNSNPNIRLRGITNVVPFGGNDGDVQIYSNDVTNRFYIKINGAWKYMDLQTPT